MSPQPLLLLLALTCLVPVAAQQESPNLVVEGEHPRLLLPARRSRLLRRETERQSLRWTQFQTLVLGGAQMPERGFALALFYAASGSEIHGRRAIEWALGPGNDLRQLALVFDWCQPLLSKSESERLAGRIRTATEAAGKNDTVEALRSRVFAAIALAGHVADIDRVELRYVWETWWRGRIAPALQAGRTPFRQADHYALFELMHVLRDNLDLDLRETAPKFFTELPAYHILAHYPAPYPAAENDYRIPVMEAHGEPDLRQAILSRAAGLSMVAYDNNAQLSQFLQGWLLLDRYLLRSPLGIPYEFLWANPYQPGLSYHYLPLGFHDPRTGRLLLRSSWEDDAVWFYHSEEKTQMFRDGKITNLASEAFNEPLTIGNSVLMAAAAATRFQVQGEGPWTYYIVGLAPKARYELEVDDEELREVETDAGGILELAFPAGRAAVVRLRPAPGGQTAAPSDR